MTAMVRCGLTGSMPRTRTKGRVIRRGGRLRARDAGDSACDSSFGGAKIKACRLEGAIEKD